MSDIIEILPNAASLEHRSCYVAYTLNGKQPVLCSYIGDQPLHYMDEEIVEEEEEVLFDPSEFGLLAHEIEVLKQELASFEVGGSSFISEDSLDIFNRFSENAESLDEDFTLTQAQSAARLDAVLSVLEESRLAAAYLNIARKHEIDIAMSTQIEDAFYDRRSGCILINPNMDFADQVLLLSRELRRHWQHRQGVLINPLTFQPENAILINRAQEADLVVSIIRIAWELQLANVRDVWERVEQSALSDLARSFAREAFLDFRTLNNGVAATAVFESWFLSERCRMMDRQIIQDMLSDHNGYVFENPASSEKVTMELLSNLGNMPFGKNYLSAHVYTIVEDAIFTDVRDRSNANFLWFIKFERTFKEAEQDLQLDSDLSTHGIRHTLLEEKGQGQNNEQSADVIQLFEYQSEEHTDTDGSLLSRSQGSGRGAQIIDLKKWSSSRR